jgi:hypothetical protein
MLLLERIKPHSNRIHAKLKRNTRNQSQNIAKNAAKIRDITKAAA